MQGISVQANEHAECHPSGLQMLCKLLAVLLIASGNLSEKVKSSYARGCKVTKRLLPWSYDAHNLITPVDVRGRPEILMVALHLQAMNTDILCQECCRNVTKMKRLL